MGIDVYMRWDEQTAAEREGQVIGFDITAGKVGYLRESIGGTHAITWLFPEAFADEDGTLENARRWYSGNAEQVFAGALTEAIGASIGPDDSVSWSSAVEQTAGGFPPEGYCVSARKVERIDPRWPEEPETSWSIPGEVLRRRLPLCEELTHMRYADWDGREEAVESLRGFVDLYSRLGADGCHPSIHVSY